MQRPATPRAVIVLMGGISSEHDVSLASGAMMTRGLEVARSQPRIKPVRIDRDGRWRVPDGWPGSAGLQQFDSQPALRPGAALASIESEADVVMLALHGPGGEDGHIQGFLETAGLPYTGAGVTGSALAIDKELAKHLLRAGGLPTPRSIAVGRAGARPARLIELADDLGWPLVVKHPTEGSSTGVMIVEDAPQLLAAVESILARSPSLLLEEHVVGRELTCGVLARPGGGGLEALPVTEIQPLDSPFFDLHAKYTPGATREITPAPLEPEETAQVRELALAAHSLLRCGSVSRTDVILGDNGPTILEVNTLPGMTETSLLPQGAAAAGLAFSPLLERLIDLALERPAAFLEPPLSAAG